MDHVSSFGSAGFDLPERVLACWAQCAAPGWPALILRDGLLAVVAASDAAKTVNDGDARDFAHVTQAAGRLGTRQRPAQG